MCYLLFLLSLLGLSSCEKDFVLKDPQGETRMVVNCQLDGRSPIKVYVTESSSPINISNITALSDAVTQLYKNDSLIEVLPFVFSDTANTFGLFQSQSYPEPGNKYSVKVIHPKYGIVAAYDTLPMVPVVTTHQLLHYGSGSEGFVSTFRLQFQDDGSEEDYYRLNVWQWGTYITSIHPGSDTVFRGYGYSTRPEPTQPLADTVRDYDTYLLFSDQSFNGQNKELEFKFRGLDLTSTTEGYLTVELYRVSRSHYQYYKTMTEYRNSQQDAEAPAVYSNIQGGYGILMSQSVVSMTERVK
jgi:hypothetical protein